ncbi:MAG: Fur family transcriptional regulator [Smithellaceae bacterium]|nr:Fur family transcriptional regulator [Smithellaceae bacterium]
MKETGVRMFNEYAAGKGLKSTRQREAILEFFLSLDRHLSIEDLYLEIHQKYPKIGYATVCRTMKLFAEAGIALGVDFGDGLMRYEHSSVGQHHDHLVCTECGAIIEFSNDTIEKIQGTIARKHGFLIRSHRLELYGLCAACRK